MHVCITSKLKRHPGFFIVLGLTSTWSAVIQPPWSFKVLGDLGLSWSQCVMGNQRDPIWRFPWWMKTNKSIGCLYWQSSWAQWSYSTLCNHCLPPVDLRQDWKPDHWQLKRLNFTSPKSWCWNWWISGIFLLKGLTNWLSTYLVTFLSLQIISWTL